MRRYALSVLLFAASAAVFAWALASHEASALPWQVGLGVYAVATISWVVTVARAQPARWLHLLTAWAPAAPPLGLLIWAGRAVGADDTAALAVVTYLPVAACAVFACAIGVFILILRLMDKTSSETRVGQEAPET